MEVGGMRLARRLWFLWRRRFGGARQTCRDCWRNDGIDFLVPNVVWRLVTGWHDGGGVLCLACFDRRAERKDVDYSAFVAVGGRRCWMAPGGAYTMWRALRPSNAWMAETGQVAPDRCPRAP
jgi:hypothetical protein